MIRMGLVGTTFWDRCILCDAVCAQHGKVMGHWEDGDTGRDISVCLRCLPDYDAGREAWLRKRAKALREEAKWLDGVARHHAVLPPSPYAVCVAMREVTEPTRTQAVYLQRWGKLAAEQVAEAAET
jgi:hypothetical protein